MAGARAALRSYWPGVLARFGQRHFLTSPAEVMLVVSPCGSDILDRVTAIARATLQSPL